MAIPVDEKFGEVPRDIGVALFVGTLTLQQIVQIGGMRAVDVYLAENREVRMIFALRKFQYFGITARFLGTKLIAGKGHYGERMIAEFFLQSTQPGVLIGKASAAGYVND